MISINALIGKLTEGKNLSTEEAQSAMEGMISGTFTPAQSAALHVALKMKVETNEEITAFAKIMRKHAVAIHPKAKNTDDMGLVDTCGTGGDASFTFNISTAAALIAASAGVKIAKHGNRSISGKSGSADVIEALGIKILQPQQVEKCINECGFGFMFAPYFHPAMKNIMPVRKELGIRTVFNVLGPLTNPAGAQAQLLGVFNVALAPKLAEVLQMLGTKHALVVHSEGMDEIGLGKTNVCELKDGSISTYVIDASEFGMKKRTVPTAQSKEESAAIVLEVLAGKPGAALDVSLLNAAAAIYVSGKAETIKQGLEIAREAVKSGAANKKLEQLRAFTGE